ncbi:MAG: hypothetical protein H6925_03920 [Holosporaceae bacterium]|nr:MAG: hypothetical protein H6925_03920 [Holosporaceae bacterium]
MKLIKTLMLSAALFAVTPGFSAAEELEDSRAFSSQKLPTATAITDTGLARLKALLNREAGANLVLDGANPANGALANTSRTLLLLRADGTADVGDEGVVAMPDVSAARTFDKLVEILNGVVTN